MGSTHLAQVGFFQPVLKGLRAAGANIERPLREAGLHRFNLDDEDNYVPQCAVLSLFDVVKSREGVDDFISRFNNRVQIAQLANWGNTLSHRSNLLSACRFAARYGHVVLTNQRIKLDIIGRKAKVSLLSLDRPDSDWSHLEHLNFAYMYSTFGLAAGADTAPDEIHLQSQTAPNLDVLLPSGNNTRVLLEQPSTALVFPAEILTAAMLGRAAGTAMQPPFLERPPGVADSIASILDSWANDRIPNLSEVAEVLDMSSRTLQRRINLEGRSFSEIVDSWRLTKSIDLLSIPGMKIGEISLRLGYANSANFDRAFRRWTGVSPRTYRDY